MRRTLLLFFLILPGFLPGICNEVAAAEKGMKTIVIPADQSGDQFDRDFADDFADDFDKDFEEQNNTREELIADPLEGINREIFWFNDKLYFYAIKPVARGYRTVVPRPARRSVDNFFANLASPIRVANNFLQFKFYDMGTELYRFIVNSTIGLGGLFDPAGAYVKLERKNEDFGQTLGYYGTGHGFYLVLPVLGPSSLRDATGELVDSFLDPWNAADLEFVEYMGVKTFRVVNTLSLDKDTYEGIVRDAIDPYLFIRAAYAQRRMAQVGQPGYNLNIFSESDSEPESSNMFNWLGM